MGDREELAELEELDRLEQKARGPAPSTGDVALSAIGRGAMNLLNTPATLANTAIHGLAGPFLRDKVPTIPNLPMKAAEAVGAVDPNKEPRTWAQRIVNTAIETGVQAGMLGGPAAAGIGLVGGAAAQGVKELTGSDLLAMATGLIAPIALTRSKTILASEGQKDVLKEAQKYGMVVEPSKVRQPSSTAETIAGKASIAQKTIEHNQPIANDLAAQAIGLPKGTPLKPVVLDELKERIAKVYNEIDDLHDQLRKQGSLDYFPRYHSPSLSEELITARQQSKALWKAYWEKPDLAVQKAAKEADSLVAGIESDIDRIAKAADRPDLLTRMQKERQLYARIKDVEEAVNPGSYNVSLPVLGKMVKEGRPLTGELNFLGRFQQAFKRSARETESLPPSGVSATDAIVGSGLAEGGMAATGSKLGLLAGGLPLLREPMRNRVLSPAYQRRLLDMPPIYKTKEFRTGAIGLSLYNTMENPQE